MSIKKHQFQFDFEEYDQLNDLIDCDQILIKRAIEIAQKAYAPYSNFPVGAAVMLDDGETFAGNNQENIAFPSGTCAERTVLNYVHANYPNQKIHTIAITALNATSENPVSPCGFCRQVLLEIEQIQEKPMRVLLHKVGFSTYVFQSAKDFLPLAFDDDKLKNKTNN